MLKKAFRNKFLATTFIAVLLSSFNLCGFENAVLSYQLLLISSSGQSNESGECVAHSRSHDAEGRNNSEKDSDASLCCSDLVAIQNPTNSSLDIKHLKDHTFDLLVFERLFAQENARPKYQVEFPPGASPPAVFRLTHFTHAPPILS